MPRLERYINGRGAGAANAVGRGVLDGLTSDLSRRVMKEVEPLLKQQGATADTIRVYLEALTPILRNTISKAVDGLGPEIESLAKQLKRVEKGISRLDRDVQARAITQSDLKGLKDGLVGALSRVQIPDYSEALRELRNRPGPDLQPLLEQVKALQTEERPSRWNFSIERDRNGLIQTVEATAED